MILRFTSAEGSFFAYIYEDTRSKVGKKVSLRYSLAHHSRDEMLLRSLIQHLDCGQVHLRANGNAAAVGEEDVRTGMIAILGRSEFVYMCLSLLAITPDAQ